MMQKFTLLFIIFCSSISIFSQNLVPNPSFEEFEECPWDVTLRHKKMLIPQWYLPNKGTSDYFNNCATFQVDIPNNFMGNLWAINGNAYVGIILKEYHSKDTTNRKARDYREYLQAELKNPLEYFLK